MAVGHNGDNGLNVQRPVILELRNDIVRVQTQFHSNMESRAMVQRRMPRNVFYHIALVWLSFNTLTLTHANTININVKKQSLYTSVIDSHIENSKNWNCEFSCRAHHHNAEVLRN